jgi:hypothetical protein
LYSKHAQRAITKLNSARMRIPPKKATKPSGPMLGIIAPPMGIQINVLGEV